MAKDHFVPQVYLKQFADPSTGGMVHAIKKCSGTTFNAWPKDICRTENGSTNDYLAEPRIIEKLLKGIEPAYERILGDLHSKRVTPENREILAGLFAYFIMYTPTALRLLGGVLKHQVEALTRVASAAGTLEPIDLPEFPPFHGKTVAHLIDSGRMTVNVDSRMGQAMATTKLLDVVKLFCACDWTVVHANDESSLFFSSDHPSAILCHVEGKFAQRVFPVSPYCAIVVHTDTGYYDANRTPKIWFTDPRKGAVMRINEQIVASAEDLVFFAKPEHWISKFVKKHSSVRLDMVGDSVGPLTLFQERIVANA